MLEYLIITYGYPALFVGTFFEGETVLIIAGFAAQRGHLSLPWVILLAFAGAFTCDQLWFHLGRVHGRTFIERRPVWAARAARAQTIIDRHIWLIALTFRFVYGMRSVIPLVLGAGGMSHRRFAVLNGFGAAVWAVIIAFAGYAFGKVVTAVVRDVARYELRLIALLALLGGCAWSIHLWRRRSAARRAAASVGGPQRSKG